MLAFLLGVFTLIQYISGHDFGIDEFFVDPVFITKTSHPGRMAPNTALCFLLCGFAFNLVGLKRALVVSLAFSVLILSSVSLVGYLFEHETLYGWGQLTRMAIHTASGFLILSSGIAAYGIWGWRKRKFDFWQTLPFAIAIIIGVLTVFTWYTIKEETEARNQAYKQGLVNDTQAILIDRYNLYESAIRGGLGLYYASESVEREEWQRYVEALNVKHTLPGINGVGYIDYVLAQSIDDYVLNVRSDGSPDSRNHPDTFYPDKFIIKYIEPVENNRKALGLDIGFEANRRAAAERARDLGVPALTKKILLVQDRQKHAGFLLLIPVYDTKNTPKTIEERREHFQGWVYAPFIGPNFLSGLSSINHNQLDFAVYDGKKIAKEALIHNSSSADIDQYLGSAIETQLKIAGRTWTIVWWPNKNFVPPANENLDVFLLIFGLSFAGFLYFTLGRLLHSKELIRRKVDEKTRELKESESKNKAILFNTVDAILTIDDKGIIQSFNPAAELMFGYDITEVISQNVNMLMPEPYKSQHDDYIDSFIHTGEAKFIGTTRELKAVRADGSVFPIELSVSEVELQNGKLFSGIIRDVTQQKEDEAALKEAMQFQDLIKNSIPDYMFVKDSEFRIVQANDAFLKLYPEEKRDKIIGSTTVENFSAEDAEKFLMYDRVTQHEGFSEVEETITFADGAIRTLLTKKVRFEDAKKDVFILGISRDITDLKKTSEEREEMRYAMQNAVEGIAKLDKGGHCLFINEAYADLFGYTQDELIGKHWKSIIDPV